ncbi:MAG: hypothetical protein ACI4VE_03170 [Clostridia bacterium]
MFLDFLIDINKKKLEKLINLHNNYDEIVKQSQKVDRLLNKKTHLMLEKNTLKKVKDKKK